MVARWKFLATYLVSVVGVDANQLTTIDSGGSFHVDTALALGVALAVATRSIDLAVVVGI